MKFKQAERKTMKFKQAERRTMKFKQAVTGRRLSIWLGAIALLCVLVLPVSSAAAGGGGNEGTHTWYVEGGANANGNGSLRFPFDSLAEVQAASRPNDRIVVLSGSVLDGGIALQPGQQLIGSGPSAQLTNTNPAQNAGAAVVLSSGTVVSHLHILNTVNAGIQGDDAVDVTIQDNLITGFNTSGGMNYCFSNTSPKCFATPYPGINLLVDQGDRGVQWNLADNAIRDGNGTGITVRVSGGSSVDLRVSNSQLVNLADPMFPPQFARHSEGILMNTFDTSVLHAVLRDNYYDSIGSDTSNSDSHLSVLDGSSTQDVYSYGEVRRDTNDVGGTSATAYETWAPLATAPGAHLNLTVDHADFRGLTSDGLQLDSNNGNVDLNVKVIDSVIGDAISGGTKKPPPGVSLLNAGSCIWFGPDGSLLPGTSPTVNIEVVNSVLENCKVAGVAFQHAPGNLQGHLTIRGTKLIGNGLAGLWVESFPAAPAGSTPSGNMVVRATDSTFSGSPTGIAVLDQNGQTANTDVNLDQGNAIVNNPVAVWLSNVDASAKHDWWGSPFGPTPGTLVLDGTSQLTYEPVLQFPPN